MYAVIALGGKQYRVTPGEKITVDRLPHEEGATFDAPVVLAVDGDNVVLDASKATVSARVERHTLGKKIHIFTYRPKQSYSRRKGHRSRLSVVSIESIKV